MQDSRMPIIFWQIREASGCRIQERLVADPGRYRMPDTGKTAADSGSTGMPDADKISADPGSFGMKRQRKARKCTAFAGWCLFIILRGKRKDPSALSVQTCAFPEGPHSLCRVLCDIVLQVFAEPGG